MYRSGREGVVDCDVLEYVLMECCDRAPMSGWLASADDDDDEVDIT